MDGIPGGGMCWGKIKDQAECVDIQRKGKPPEIGWSREDPLGSDS